MDTKQLKSFQLIYETGSISKAAGKLFITPQGLSKSVRQLEQELGVILFKRSIQGVSPTEAAVVLYDRLSEVISRLDAIREEMQRVEKKQTALRFGAANGVFNLLPFGQLLGYMEARPDLQLSFGEYANQEVKDLLRAEKLDYGLIVGQWDDPEVVSRAVAACDICLLVYEGHPLYENKIVTIDMLKQEKLVTMNERFRMYGDFCDACEVRGFTPNIIARTADSSFQRRICRQKLGLAVVPAFEAESGIPDGLRAIPFQEHLKWTVYLAYLRNRKNLPDISGLLIRLTGTN